MLRPKYQINEGLINKRPEEMWNKKLKRENFLNGKRYITPTNVFDD